MSFVIIAENLQNVRYQKKEKANDALNNWQYIKMSCIMTLIDKWRKFEMSIHDFYDESPTKMKTREKILEAAATLFIKNGIELVSMKEVALGGELTSRNLSRYYPGKEYLVVDVAYHLFYQFGISHGFVINEMDNGLKQLESYLDQLVDSETQGGSGESLVVFIMYFDLYLTKVPECHKAYQKYILEYVPIINQPGYQMLGAILRKGIGDGTIEADESELNQLCDYVLQSLVSITARALIKEKENKRINRTLITRHKQIILDYLSKEKR